MPAEVFDKITDAIDLILLDLVLPDSGGFEICRKLKEDQITKTNSHYHFKRKNSLR